MIDELTSFIAVVLTLSCIISFASIRTLNATSGGRLEMIADYLFMISLFGILAIILLISLNYVN